MRRRDLLLGAMSTAAIAAEPKPVRFGVIADIHFGVMPKAEERLEKFLTDATTPAVPFGIV